MSFQLVQNNSETSTTQQTQHKINSCMMTLKTVRRYVFQKEGCIQKSS